MRCLSMTLLAVTSLNALLIPGGAAALAQTRVRTETIRPAAPPAAADAQRNPEFTGAIIDRRTLAPPAPAQAPPEVITDLALLPPQVSRTRERILAAARSGRLDRLVAVMQSNETMPIFSLNDDKDPLAYWKANYPDSGGVEILATLIDILEAGFVHVDAGTPQEMYLWPYFARMPPKDLTPEQKVELFKIVTGADYRDMLTAGSYNFFRLGIGGDGAWRFFVTGD